MNAIPAPLPVAHPQIWLMMCHGPDRLTELARRLLPQLKPLRGRLLAGWMSMPHLVSKRQLKLLVDARTGQFTVQAEDRGWQFVGDVAMIPPAISGLRANPRRDVPAPPLSLVDAPDGHQTP